MSPWRQPDKRQVGVQWEESLFSHRTDESGINLLSQETMKWISHPRNMTTASIRPPDVSERFAVRPTSTAVNKLTAEPADLSLLVQTQRTNEPERMRNL